MRPLILGTIIIALTAVCAFLLTYARPDLFPLEWAVPTAFTYVAQFALLLVMLHRRGKHADVAQKRKFVEAFLSKKRAAPGWLDEFLVFGVFLVLGVLAGTISGTVWWAVGGHTIRSFRDALVIGAISGGGAMILLFGGA